MQKIKCFKYYHYGNTYIAFHNHPQNPAKMSMAKRTPMHSIRYDYKQIFKPSIHMYNIFGGQMWSKYLA